jgi:Fe-S cluster biogenesis protein NfuA
MSEQKEFERQVASIEGMVRTLEETADPASSASARELLQAVMGLHGVCLERMVEIVRQTGALGQAILDSFATDEKVRSLLLLYDLHPLGMETRVLQALEKTRPYLRSLGGEASLVGVDDAGVAAVRLDGSREGGCPSSAANLRAAVEQTIYEAAPDVTAIQFEGSLHEPTPAALGFVPVAALLNFSDNGLMPALSSPGVERGAK